MFARDIDLLVTEPNLFADAAWHGQRLVSASGTLSGTTLTLSGLDLTAAQVDAGCVVLMGGVPLEVVQRLSATTLQVSIVRWARSGPVIPPVGFTTGPCEVWTLRPQIELAHRQVLALIGSADTSGSVVLNGEHLVILETLLALHVIYAAAASSASVGEAAAGLRQKAESYRLRAGAERSRVSARIDVDGDGAADSTRRPGVIPLVRG